VGGGKLPGPLAIGQVKFHDLR